jgi:hypothetical protein
MGSNEPQKTLNLDLEEKKLNFEREKLDRQIKLDREKELYKVAGAVITILGSVILAYIAFSNDLDLQEQQALSDFKLKAAEIAMSAKTPIGTENKAKALQNLFPTELGPNFGRSFDPKDFGFVDDRGRREQLMDVLVKYNESRDEILDTWWKLFPEDRDWLKEENNTISLSDDFELGLDEDEQNAYQSVYQSTGEKAN